MIEKKYLYNDYQLKISKILDNLLSNSNIFEKRNCGICNSNEFEVISDKDRYGLEYHTGICKKCGLLQQYRYPNKEFIHLFYTKYYNGLYSFFKDASHRFKNQYETADYKFKLVSKFLNPNQKKVLEIGCGPGGILSYFKTQGFDCIGIDYDNEDLQYGKSLGLQLYDVKKEINQKFDLIILSHVIEHLEDFNKFIEYLEKYIKNNTYIYIEVPSIESIKIHYDSKLLNFLHIAHVTHFSLNTFKNFLIKYNLHAHYIDNKIHAVLSFNSGIKNKIIVNYYQNTKKLLKQLLLYHPFIYSKNFIKKTLKFFLKKLKL